MLTRLFHGFPIKPAEVARAVCLAVILGGLCYIVYFGTLALALCSALQNEFGASCW